MTTTQIAPLDNVHATTYNRIATGGDENLAYRFDNVLRTLITATGGRKIAAIKILRDLAVVFGAGEFGLLEAKSTIDAMSQRMIIENLRTLLSVPVGSGEYERLIEVIDRLDPRVVDTLGIR